MPNSPIDWIDPSGDDPATATATASYFFTGGALTGLETVGIGLYGGVIAGATAYVADVTGAHDWLADQMAAGYVGSVNAIGSLCNWAKKHTPGRDHDGKSKPKKQERFRAKAQKAREQGEKELTDAWDNWNNLPKEVQKLRPELKPGKLDPRQK